MNLNREAVLALAPDAASIKAAQGLTAAAQWPLLGRSERAVWGQCRDYEVKVDLQGASAQCSCPSRKYPCKHSLALMLLQADQPTLLQEAAPPAWVERWLTERDSKAAAKQAKTQAKAEAAATQDPAAVAKRAAQRWSRIEKGCEDLERWMLDQIEAGIGSNAQPPGAAFRTLAARLVDAQAPGLARRLQDADIDVRQPDWPQRLLRLLGELHLIVQAVMRRDTLDPATLADLRTTLGWPLEKDELQHGPDQVEDRWQVLGLFQQVRDDGLLERRVWLHGQQSSRYALLLDHVFGNASFAQLWLPGQQAQARLSFYPGNHPQRAVVLESHSAGDSAAAMDWPLQSLDEALDAASHQFAANPWCPRVPFCLRAGHLHRHNDAWHLRVADRLLPLQLRDSAAWELHALSGGVPFDLFGDWDGQHLQLLAAHTQDGPWSHAGESNR